MIPFGEERPRRLEEKGPFVFRLYVVDKGPSSARAIANLSAICKNHLPDNHQIEIVDLFECKGASVKMKITDVIQEKDAPHDHLFGEPH